MIKTNEITIIHVANFHIRLEYENDINILKWYDMLTNDIISNVKSSMDNIYFVIAGDLAYTANLHEYKLFDKIFCNIYKNIGIKRENILIVPGNHDLNWEKNRSDRQKEFQDYYILKTYYDLKKQVCHYQDTNLVFLLFNSVTSKYNDIGLINSIQLRKVIKGLQELELDNSLLISVMHHGIDSRISGNHVIKNDNQFKTFLNEWGISILLHGSSNIPGLTWSASETAMGKQIYIGTGSISPEIWKSNVHNSQYNLINIVNNREITITTRVFIPQSGKWVQGMNSPIKLKLVRYNKLRPLISPTHDNRPKYSKQSINSVLELLNTLSLHDLEMLNKNLQPDILFYNPIIESKSDYIWRLVTHFNNEQSLYLIHEAIKKVLGKGRYSHIRVYVSLSSNDYKTVKNILNSIENMGYNVWFARKNIHRGDMISQKISKNILFADIILIFISKHSLKSYWSRLEAEIAIKYSLKSNSRILVIRLEKCNIPDFLNHFQIIDISLNDPYSSRILISALNKLDIT
jgi:hypothetical protein